VTRRAGALTAVVAMVGAGLVPLLPRWAWAATSTLCTNSPSVSSMTVNGAPRQFGPVGSNVVVNGSGFTSLTCNRIEITFPGGASAIVTASSSSQFSFTTVGGMSGQMSVAAVDGNNQPSSADNHLIYVTTPSSSGVNPQNPFAGAKAQLTGSNFDFHLSAGSEQYSAQYSWLGAAGGGPCPGTVSGPPSLATTNGPLTLPMPSQYCDGSVAVTISAPCNTTNQNCDGSTSPRMSFALQPQPFDIAPQVTRQTTSATSGSTATITGSGFGTSGSVSINGASASSTWTDTQITYVVPDDATSGSVQAQRSLDGTSVFATAASLGITARLDGFSPAKAAVGDQVTITGGGFGAQASSSSVSIGSTQATVDSWGPTSIVVTVAPNTVSGTISVNPVGNNPPTPLQQALTVVAKITGTTPSHATAGSLIEIDGTTFGTQQGTVDIGGQSAQVTLWGDKSVLVMVPSQLSPGSTTITLTPPNADPASFPFSVDVPPTAPPQSSSSSSSSSSSGSRATPTPGFIPPNPAGPIISHGPVDFVKPPPAPGPVSLKLESSKGTTDPGATVDFTVTLEAFGKPLVGAPVDLLMVIEPGADASLDPSHAVTDANGQVHGVIHLSRTPGDHIVLARSGIYSDEIRVVGRGAHNVVAAAPEPGGAASAPSGPSFLQVRSPILWALASCLLLFGLGFGLNLATAPAAAGAGAGAAVARRGVGGSLRRTAAMILDGTRYAAGTVAVLLALGLGTFRRSR
jgi:hypothetical protein